MDRWTFCGALVEADGTQVVNPEQRGFPGVQLKRPAERVWLRR